MVSPRNATAMTVVAALILSLSALPASAQSPSQGDSTSGVSPETIVTTSLEEGVAVTTVESSEFFGEAVVDLEGGEFAPIEVSATVDGDHLEDAFTIETFTLLSESGADYVATLRSGNSGEVFTVDTTAVEQQIVPAVILALLARQGLATAVKFYGKTQVKKAAKSYLLNNISATKWNHIMNPKHLWGEVGARSREQIADLMGSAMANGNHVAYGGARKAIWSYNGRTIEVTYSSGGQISNGWVKPR